MNAALLATDGADVTDTRRDCHLLCAERQWRIQLRGRYDCHDLRLHDHNDRR